ncbi:polyamine aminopropyltransferase [Pseudoalteromonas aurantia]|uniref:Spermidine synthase n=1 Tax=Pseudoalteromonas aurantia 208 TaxID=1314867 RepID=A0ABR9EHW0_9GAMM|nr:hypothetical protein [Pseudoalteromonas aurantia]MBE0370546.1 hypothetical protein [Pseudoalteromonas aurantia 208]
MYDLEQESTDENLKASHHEQELSLFVYENHSYRWLTFSDGLIQGIMSLANPSHIIAPVGQALLLFVLAPQPSYRVLNLGLGTAAIERALNHLANSTPFTLDTLVSVEHNAAVAHCAQAHFEFTPSTLHIGCAQQYIDETSLQFDVILLDIIHTDQKSDFLQHDKFWQKISQTLSAQGQITFNFNPYSEQGLIALLKRIKAYFKTIYIIEFHDYKNLIISAYKAHEERLTRENIEHSILINQVAPNLSSSIKKILKL